MKRLLLILSMKPNILVGGQAVIEGVMMRVPGAYSTAVRCPNGDIKIKFTGLRPGEKLYEELLIGDSINKTKHEKIFRAEEDYLSKEDIDKYLDSLKEAMKINDVMSLKSILKEVVLGFEPEKENVDVVHLQKKRKR